jgi:hypothetical protein
VLENQTPTSYLAELKTRGPQDFNIFLSDPYGMLGPDHYSSAPILQHPRPKSFTQRPVDSDHPKRCGFLNLIEFPYFNDGSKV